VTPAVRAVPEGATVRVRVSPGARREAIRPFGDALKISVRQPPEKGRANREVERLLAEAVAAPPRDVAVVRGGTAPDKVVLFRGWTEERLRAALEKLLETTR